MMDREFRGAVEVASFDPELDQAPPEDLLFDPHARRGGELYLSCFPLQTELPGTTVAEVKLGIRLVDGRCHCRRQLRWFRAEVLAAQMPEI